MALIWADFPSGQRGIYDSNTNMLNGVWAEIQSATSAYDPLVDDPDPSIGSNGIVFFANAGTSSSGEASEGGRMALPAEVTTLGLSFRWWLSKLPTDSNFYPFVSVRNNTNGDILHIRVSTTGQISAHSGGNQHGSGGTTLSTTSGPVLLANTWQHVQMKVTKGAGTGALQIRVNDVTVMNLTDLNLSASNIAQFVLGCHEAAGGTDGAMAGYWKDLVVWDTSGTHVNDFPGQVFVYDLVPDGDNDLNWTPSTGSTGFNLIDEQGAPVDTDYISADNTLPDASIFTMTDLPEDTVSVRAVMTIGRMVKTDGGDCNVLMSVSPDNVDWDDGADRPITVANTYWWDVSHTSPATAANWTVDEVNDILFKVDRTL